jgi:hypothetical protein
MRNFRALIRPLHYFVYLKGYATHTLTQEQAATVVGQK